jgi:formylglycine-generating enzyme required for sulfatase activity
MADAFSRLRSPELGDYFLQNSFRPDVLHKCAEAALTERSDQRLVLFIDQSEEIFTQIHRDKAQAFVEQLAQAIDVETGRVILLFAMRSDFIPNCVIYPRLNELLNRQFIQIGAMQEDELVSAIAQPALRVNLKIDPDLIAQIINDMRGEPGVLPLMQFTLRDLFDAQQAKGSLIALTRSDYIQRGGIHRSLERHADSVFTKLSEREQQVARSIFSALVEVGRGTLDTRRTALLNELIPSDTRSNEVKTVLQKLATARLVITDTTTVTISHEKLIDAWPWLRRLVDENRDVIAFQNEITRDAVAWEEHKQDPSYLYVGARLANAREKVGGSQLILSEQAQRFLSTSIEAEDRKNREEELRRQKELENARQLAETAQARAKAERRGRIIGRWMLVTAFILIVVLGSNPVRNEVFRRQAMKSDMVSIPAYNGLLGDPRQPISEYFDEYLIYKKYSVESFSIDAYPVTNRRYRLCMRARICSQPNDFRSIYEEESNLDKPVVNITAADAAQFCHWIGQLLPSDKEWELAAREGKIHRPLSESDTVDYFYEWTRAPYQQSDSEWTNPLEDPPPQLTKKGGSLDQPLSEILTFRQSARSTYSADYTGFRCALKN